MKKDNLWDKRQLGADEHFVEIVQPSSDMEARIDEAIGVETVTTRIKKSALDDLIKIAQQAEVSLNIVLSEAIENYVKSSKNEDDSIDVNINELNRLVERADEIYERAKEEDSHEGWETAYKLIFSRHISHRISECLNQLNLENNYYDPDADYEDDIVAYINAIKEVAYRATRVSSRKPK